MHTVIEPYCTGCELCIPVCPVDCIALEPVDANLTGWHAWSQDLANVARARYESKTVRLARLQKEEEQRLEALANTRKADS
jgi:electron transport complex protein RnfB